MKFHRCKKALLGAFGAALIAGLAAVPVQAQSYQWGNVKISGGGYVPGIIAHPGQQGLYYARTDVGGAYRYNNATKTWIALSDWVGSLNWQHSAIDAIAIDPSDTSKLYMVAGMYYHDPIKAVFLRSTNQGASFTQIPLSFTAGGNQHGRQVGERLMVDPNKGSVLFYGTGNNALNNGKNGLWKSTDSGSTWTKVSGFPALSNDNTGAGVSFIAFHKSTGSSGNATQTIFAGVNTKTAEQTGGATLYQSTDGGNTWSPVYGPTGVLPQRGQIGPDGNLYITYAAWGLGVDDQGQTVEKYGPDGLKKGQVWKYNIANKQWSWITPWNSYGDSTGQFNGYSGLSVHPTQSGTLMVNTIDRYDAQGETAYISTDGGAHWTDTIASATFDGSAAGWTGVYGPHHTTGNWSASVLDPYNASHAFVTSGGGIWESTNLNAANPRWALAQNGIEEVVVEALVSPPPNQYGAVPLISGGPDICGFVHTSVSTAPATSFSNPACSHTTGMDYSKSNSTYVVRVGHDKYPPTDKHFGAISWNGGYTWNPFNSHGTAAENTSGLQGGGGVAVNADGSAILWAPQNASVAYSTNHAYSWTSLGAALPQNMKIVADGANPNMFYAYHRQTGQFYTSSDKGVTWAATNPGLPGWGGQLAAPVGIQGEVWLPANNGLFRTRSSGWGTWTQMPGVTQASALGFGKAAPGATMQAIYVVGTVAGIKGYHRSIDGGNTWVRINDDQHNWYGSNHVITGDPKTFGTVYIGTNGRGIVYGTSAN